MCPASCGSSYSWLLNTSPRGGTGELSWPGQAADDPARTARVIAVSDIGVDFDVYYEQKVGWMSVRKLPPVTFFIAIDLGLSDTDALEQWRDRWVGANPTRPRITFTFQMGSPMAPTLKVKLGSAAFGELSYTYITTGNTQYMTLTVIPQTVEILQQVVNPSDPGGATATIMGTKTVVLNSVNVEGLGVVLENGVATYPLLRIAGGIPTNDDARLWANQVLAGGTNSVVDVSIVNGQVHTVGFGYIRNLTLVSGGSPWFTVMIQPTP